MSEVIPIRNLVYDKDTFAKVINTQFSELNFVPPTTPDTTLENFFELYDELFTEIPREGDVASHRFILEREAEYLGVRIADDSEVQALLQEITDLRQQLLEAETTNASLEAQTGRIQ
jgi:hypothetical protein